MFDFTGTSSGGRPNGSLVIREDTFTPPAESTMAFESEGLISVSIHPNPSTDNFNIHVKSPARERIQLAVTDQYGQLITTYEITTDTPMQIGGELKRGIYILKVIQGNEITMQRVVKK